MVDSKAAEVVTFESVLLAAASSASESALSATQRDKTTKRHNWLRSTCNQTLQILSKFARSRESPGDQT